MYPPPECPPPDDTSSGLAHPPAINAYAPEYSPQERSLLLRLAHEAILAALEQREISLTPPTSHLAEPRGVFTTLYYRGNLRGCVGFVFPVASLYRTVAESAQGAAFDDTRFSPVTCGEAAELEVSLSILSAPQPVQPDAVEIGRHGLLVNSARTAVCCFPKCRSNTPGTAPRSWNRRARKPGSPPTPGKPVRSWRLSPRKCLAIGKKSRGLFAKKIRKA